MTPEKRPKKVLLIDDDEDILLFTKELLETNGYKTITAQTGKEGLSLFKKHKPDLVITDVFMPNLSGIEVIKKVLAITPDQKIIALSGFEDITKRVEYLGLSMAVGATRFLQKPIEPRVLLDNVQRSLRKPAKRQILRVPLLD